MSDLYFG